MRKLYKFTRTFDLGEKYKTSLSELKDSCVVEVSHKEGNYESLLLILSNRSDLKFIVPKRFISIRPFFLKEIRKPRLKISEDYIDEIKLRYCTQNSTKPSEDEIKEIKKYYIEHNLLQITL